MLIDNHKSKDVKPMEYINVDKIIIPRKSINNSKQRSDEMKNCYFLETLWMLN